MHHPRKPEFIDLSLYSFKIYEGAFETEVPERITSLAIRGVLRFYHCAIWTKGTMIGRRPLYT